MTVIDGSERFLEVRGAVFSDFQQAVRKFDSAFPTGTFQAFTDRLRNCFRHAFSRKLGELLGKSVRFLVLDVEAHSGTILPSLSTMLPQKMARTNGAFRTGFGDFELRYLRDKEKREVDLLVVRDRKPWFLVEVKLRDTNLAPWLRYFQAQAKATHAFQAVIDLAHEATDCFQITRPVVVPAKTLLSQLLIGWRNPREMNLGRQRQLEPTPNSSVGLNPRGLNVPENGSATPWIGEPAWPGVLRFRRIDPGE